MASGCYTPEPRIFSCAQRMEGVAAWIETG
jgi:hypothetical protein